jgi:conserved domain protein|nr:MAG TPA: Choline binding protein [Caudoviricetes sp.]
MKKLAVFLTLIAWAAGADKFDCSKKYCKEMKSCEEAYHYFKNCGRGDFDRDGDGVPCENVCGKGKK